MVGRIAALPEATGYMQAMGAAKSGRPRPGGQEVFVECTEHKGLPSFEISGQCDNPHLVKLFARGAEFMMNVPHDR